MFEACVSGNPSQPNSTWEDDIDNDPFASDVEADLEEDEAGIEDE